MGKLNLIVADPHAETGVIRSLSLKSATGGALPAFSAGSHLKIHVPGLDEPRCYSLVCLEPDSALFESPTVYRLGVRLEDPSGGGPHSLHRIQAGDPLSVEPPKPDFPLHTAQSHQTPPAL